MVTVRETEVYQNQTEVGSYPNERSGTVYYRPLFHVQAEERPEGSSVRLWRVPVGVKIVPALTTVTYRGFGFPRVLKLGYETYTDPDERRHVGVTGETVR
jgi:hypothetical protein